MVKTNETKYTYALGRRKTCTAVAKLFPQGKGVITIVKANGKQETVEQYFGGNKHMLQAAVMAFDVLGGTYRQQFDMTITISGGGLSGQADAIKLAIARALIDWDAELRVTLKPYGLLKRDARIKERKKPGLRGARKRPSWSKR